MKCLTCKDGLYGIYQTENCVNKTKYPDYFIYEIVIVPCSLFNTRCYECDIFLSDNNRYICLSCNPGFIFNETTNECEMCRDDDYPIIVENFNGCIDSESKYCKLYKTYCNSLKKEEHENECKKNNYNIDLNETCIITNKNYEILFINWLRDDFNYMTCPSYNNDKSDYLLIELTHEGSTENKIFKRKFYFYNDEGRGLFDEINDKYENIAELHRAYMRFYSSAMAIKLNNSEEYRYLLNFENYNNNLELIDIKTGEISIDDIFNFLWIFDFVYLDVSSNPTTHLLELHEKNTFLMAAYAKNIFDENKVYIFYWIFSLQESENQKVNIDSLKLIESHNINIRNINFNINARFFFVQTRIGCLFISFVSDKNELFLIDDEQIKNYFIYNLIYPTTFHKLLLIKDQIMFLCFYSSGKYLNFHIFEQTNDRQINFILLSQINKFLLYTDNYLYNDVIFLSEVKGVYVVEDFKGIYIFLLNFFNNYKHYMVNEFIINIYGKGMNNLCVYSLIFQYRNMIGLQFKSEDEIGFILLGYYNSTDPEKILNIKKNGLNYDINLKKYLNLQSNIFQYEIKCIRIIKIPNLYESGIYLISNITQNYIKKNDCIDINTKI